MDADACEGRSRASAQTVATIVYSSRVLVQIEHALAHPRDENLAAGPDAIAAIQSAVDHLAAHPLIGRRLTGEIRELVISYGRTGYVALYRFAAPKDDVRILAIRHQRELGFLP